MSLRINKVYFKCYFRESDEYRFSSHRIEQLIKYDDEAKIFHGEVIGLKEIITFQGSSVEELEEAFNNSVED